MHEAQIQFCKEMAAQYPEHFRECDVLEVGSRNINGTVRQFFEGCRYHGIDCTSGKDVDEVVFAHLFQTDAKYDTVICTEMLEHDPYWVMSLRTMLDCLSDSGLFIMTCATIGRPAHGTGLHGTISYGPLKGYYANVTIKDVLPLFVNRDFSTINMRHVGGDLQVWAKA